MSTDADAITLLLAGDVMTGRGIDQVLAHPGSRELHEPWVRDAREYVRLAERANGPIPAPVPMDDIWGDALVEMERFDLAATIVNLETAITAAGAPWPRKGIHYRMHPANVGCLQAARVSACALANNHVLDWGEVGLVDTLRTLADAGVQVAGAGRDLAQALAPAVLPTRDGRVLVFSWATRDCGVPDGWDATPARPGIALLQDLHEAGLRQVADAVTTYRREGDLVILSVHWGGNWVPAVPHAHRDFAHAVIARGIADVVHGHSSHHPLPFELFQGKLVLYGCGDLVNDYEGIEPQRGYPQDVACLYFATLSRRDGHLVRLRIAPLQRRAFRLVRADADARAAIRQALGVPDADLR